MTNFHSAFNPDKINDLLGDEKEMTWYGSCPNELNLLYTDILKYLNLDTRMFYPEFVLKSGRRRDAIHFEPDPNLYVGRIILNYGPEDNLKFYKKKIQGKKVHVYDIVEEQTFVTGHGLYLSSPTHDEFHVKLDSRPDRKLKRPMNKYFASIRRENHKSLLLMIHLLPNKNFIKKEYITLSEHSKSATEETLTDTNNTLYRI